jgi:ribosomal protein L34E
VQHPHATFSEIEQELDTRLAGMRARMLERVAQQSAATTWRQPAADQASGQEATAPRCPSCGTPLEARGRHRRRMRTSGDQEVALEREYGVCPQCGQGLFPPG